MLTRNGSYIFIDGTIACLEDLQSIYISRTKQGIAFQYLNGHKIEIMYEEKRTCERTWNELKAALPDMINGEMMLELHNAMIVRVDRIQHIEFDEIDYRFTILYKSGECFMFDFESKAVTLALFKKLMQKYFGVENYHAVGSRKRADFWHKVSVLVNGKVAREKTPNRDYWVKLDKALVSAEQTLYKNKEE